jgi:acyl-coenzyme A thioesterase PaaI-like protein
MNNLNSVVNKAKQSGFYLWLLNVGLNRMIPFNKPHKFSIVEIKDHRIKIKLPYRKSNFNHIRGLHACALATVSEFTTGFLLISNLDAKKYRLIMQRLEMDYHYQGKQDAYAEFEINKQWLEEKIYNPLNAHEAIVVICEVKIYDATGNHLTTGKVYWQVKDWTKVKTKVS